MSNIFKKSQLELRSNPNLLINGDFSVNQRGTDGAITHGAYTLDRWLIGSTDGVGTISVYHYTSGTPVADGVDAFVQVITSGMTGNGFLRQRCEVSPTLQGKDLTLSLQMFHGVDVPVKVSTRWYTTTYVSSSPIVEANVTTSNVFTDRATATFTVPEITSYSNANTYYLDIFIEFGNGSLPDSSYRFGNVKLEFGSVATPFIPDDPATNLAKCQRYYTESLTRHIVGQDQVSGTYHLYATINYPVHMRIAPNTGDGSLTWSLANTPAGYTGTTLTNTTTDGFYFDMVGSHTGNVVGSIHYTADAELQKRKNPRTSRFWGFLLCAS